VAPADNRRLRMHTACLADALQAPLVVAGEDKEELRKLVADWKPREIVAVGAGGERLDKLGNIKIVSLADEHAVAAACLKQQLKRGPIRTLVLANPDDLKDGYGRMST